MLCLWVAEGPFEGFYGGYGAACAPQVWKWIFTAVCFLLAAYPGPPQDTGATVLIS